MAPATVESASPIGIANVSKFNQEVPMELTSISSSPTRGMILWEDDAWPVELLNLCLDIKLLRSEALRSRSW